MKFREIGRVLSEVKEINDIQHTSCGWTADTCTIKLMPQFKGGLGGLEGYSHVIILFYINQHKKWKMPKKHHKPKNVKVFATRMPVRPNPIGLSTVELINFSTEEGTLTVKGLDAIDGTPILDIKPYIPHFDAYAEASVPHWIEEHLKEHHHGHGHSHTHGHGHRDEEPPSNGTAGTNG
jgi:tRNA (adenine37-N6)-methyltransferase